MKTFPLASALVLLTGVAHGDGAWLHETRDERGRVVGVVPRQNTTIALRHETVSLVPYLAGGEVMLYVNVRYSFANPGAASDLLIGFPEMRGRVVQHNCTYPCEPDRVTTHATIEAFAADAGGRALAVRTLPGTEDYARWFVFNVAFPSGETSLRNLYVAHPGSTTIATNTSSSLAYSAEYILHTGSLWAGPIGSGDVFLWDGASRALRHFSDLRPTRSDDVQATLHVTVEPSAGRPLFSWDYGNGQQAESTPPRREDSSVVQHSTALPGEGLAHLGAMAVDGDPTTAWVDGGPRGGVGEWVQIPTYGLRRLRGVVVRAGAAAPGISRVRRARLTCFDLEGDDRHPTELESQPIDLTDAPGEQRMVFPHPVGACQALRLTIEALHGAAGDHGSLAEVSFLE